MERVKLVIMYDDGGTAKVRAVVNKWKFQDTMMGEQYVLFNITSEKPIYWAVGDYCIFRGEVFTLNYVPSVTQKASRGEAGDAYTYENVKFEARQEELTRCLMLDITPSTGKYVAALGTNYTGSSAFQLFCGEKSGSVDGVTVTMTAVCVLVAKIQANLDRMYGTGVWTINVNLANTHTEDKMLSFNHNTVAEALAEIHNTFELDYCIKGRTIMVGYDMADITGETNPFYFGYGRGYASSDNPNKGLFEIKRIANSEQKIVTRLRVLGSKRNLPYRYYNKAYDLPQALFPLNLQLPDTFRPYNSDEQADAPKYKVDGNTARGDGYRHVLGQTNDAYIDKNDDAASCPEGIREESVCFDGSDSNLPEIYPTISGAKYSELRAAGVKDQDNHSGSGAFPNYDDDERVDKLLGVDADANIGDGILTTNMYVNGQAKDVRIGNQSYRYCPSEQSDAFEPDDGKQVGKAKTLFQIDDVLPGDYLMVPTAGSLWFNAWCQKGIESGSFKNVDSFEVGYRITIYETPKDTGVARIIRQFTSDTQTVNNLATKYFELPYIPALDGEDEPITVTALGTVKVIIEPYFINLQWHSPYGSWNGSFHLGWSVGNKQYHSEGQSDPQYTWSLAESNIEQDKQFHVFIQDMGFDIEACFNNDTPAISMKTGACTGREFTIASREKYTDTATGKKGYMLTLNRAKDDSLNTYYPNEHDTLAADDEFVILNINMPPAYIEMAEVRLLKAATDWLADNCETKFTYQTAIDDIYLQRNYDKCVSENRESESIFYRLYAGLKFSFQALLDESQSSSNVRITIEQVTISMGEGLTPKVEIKLNEDIQQSTIKKITTSIDRIYNGSVFNGGGDSASTTAALAAFLQSEGDRFFVSKIHDDIVNGNIVHKGTVQHEKEASFKKGIRIGNFISRMLGSGAIIDEDGNLEVESIYSRSFISTPEFRFNRVNVTEGENWCTNGYGTVEKVDIIDETSGYITLKLEENDYASIEVGDICRGIYNDIGYNYNTADLDDDSELYGSVGEEGDFGFSCKKGFFTSYFYVQDKGENDANCYNRKGECRFKYVLRNSNTPHPCQFMKFAQYGNLDPNSGRCSSSYSTSIGHYYEMVLDGVTTWKLSSANVVVRKGWLGDMYVTLHDGESETQLQGNGLYVQDNVYFGNAVIQLDPYTLAQLADELGSYSAEFSDYVDVITVDDVGNVIGGLYTESGEEGHEVRDYRIFSAITVRKRNELLTIAADNEDAGEGTYKINVLPHGCSCIVQNSTLYITGINNIKDGVAGSDDDDEFDYDAMRAVESISVDVAINCEGKGTIIRKFPVTIKHDSQPFVGADIDNEFSAVSWNTKTQTYIGLPIVLNMKMWHNNEQLNIESVDDVSVSPAITGMTVSKEIINVSGQKHARVTISALPANLGNVTKLNITAVAEYAGVSYERTLVHTINKGTDVNVYSLLPSLSEIIYNKNTGALNSNSLSCKVMCDSTDDKHYEVTLANLTTHKLKLCYQIHYNDGTATTAETDYTSAGVTGLTIGVEKVVFKLYNLDKSVQYDEEGVPVIAMGQDGKGVEYVFVRTETNSAPTITSNADWTEIIDEHEVTHRVTDDDFRPMTSTNERASDEPVGTTSQYKFEWVAKRVKRVINGVLQWEPYSGTMSLFANWSKDGDSVIAQFAPNNNPSSAQIHDSFQTGDEWMRTKKTSDTNWGAWMRIVGEGGAPGPGTDYKVFDFGWSTAVTTASSTTAPTLKSGTTWADAPSADPSDANTTYYLWMRITPKIWQNNTRIWTDGTVTYQRIKGNTGERGTDGDGTEYVFIRTKIATPPEVPSSGDYSEEEQDYDADEHLPYVFIFNEADISGSTTPVTPSGSAVKYVKCTDDPVGVDNEWKYEWVLKRTKAAPVNGVRSWEPYSGEMSLWAKYGDKGDPAHEIDINMLERTNFDRGLDAIKESWVVTRNVWSKITVDSTLKVKGRSCVKIDGTNVTDNYFDFEQSVLGKLKPNTKYTLSFWGCNSTANRLQVFIFGDAYGSGGKLYQGKFLVDGVEVTPEDNNGCVMFAAAATPVYHTITFKTASTIPSRAEVWFRADQGTISYICMPKLEEGDTATAYIADEGDLIGEQGPQGDDGVSPYQLKLSDEAALINCDEDGNVIPGSSYEISRLMIQQGINSKFTDFNINIVPVGILCNGNSSSFSLSEATKESADSTGYYSLIPSTITQDAAEIRVIATLKTDSNFVLTAGYKINKNKAGATGKTGPSYYPAGEYNATNNAFSRTDEMCPVVLSDGNYYYLKESSNLRNGSRISPTDQSYGSVYWGLCDNFQVVFIKALFAMFAKLGSFVVSGDWFISQYGTLKSSDGRTLTVDGTNYETKYINNDGAITPDNTGLVGYAHFKSADPTASTNADSGKLKFAPILAIDAKTGKIYGSGAEFRNGKFYGKVEADEGRFGRMIINSDGSFKALYDSNISGTGIIKFIYGTSYTWITTETTLLAYSANIAVSNDQGGFGVDAVSIGGTAIRAIGSTALQAIGNVSISGNLDVDGRVIVDGPMQAKHSVYKQETGGTYDLPNITNTVIVRTTHQGICINLPSISQIRSALGISSSATDTPFCFRMLIIADFRNTQAFLLYGRQSGNKNYPGWYDEGGNLISSMQMWNGDEEEFLIVYDPDESDDFKKYTARRISKLH